MQGLRIYNHIHFLVRLVIYGGKSQYHLTLFKKKSRTSLVIKNSPAKAGYMSSVLGQERFHMLRSNQDHVLQLLKPVNARAHAWQQATPISPYMTVRE